MEFDDLMARRRVLRGEHKPLATQPQEHSTRTTPSEPLEFFAPMVRRVFAPDRVHAPDLT